MTIQVMAGAEPASYPGGPHGALVLHGITGTPQSMRGLADALAGAGCTVELPLLPGHGTTLEDMDTTTFADWLAAADDAYRSLAARVDDVIVVGLSMGGTLAVTLAVTHPEIIGAVLVNPLVEWTDESILALLRGMVEAGEDRLAGLASDIADPEVTELAYDATPVRPLLSLIEAAGALTDRLGELRCPVLLLTSTQDHVVNPSSSATLAARAAGPVERVALERSYHVATLDHDRGLIEARAVEFARKLTA